MGFLKCISKFRYHQERHVCRITLQFVRLASSSSAKQPNPPQSLSSQDNTFLNKKILLLKKITRYEFEKQQHNNLSESELIDYLTSKGSDYNGLLARHNHHYTQLNSLIDNLKKNKQTFRIVDRLGYDEAALNWADTVFTCGGDGTFLLGASMILNREKPIVGFNTDHKRSEGHLCLPKKYSMNIPLALEKLFSGSFDWQMRSRIRISVSDKTPLDEADAARQYEHLYYLRQKWPEHRFLEEIKELEDSIHHHHHHHHHTTMQRKPPPPPPRIIPFRALNEVFVGESLSARVSYYELASDDSNYQKQKSSGVTICTGTGSTSWHFHINHLCEQSLNRLFSVIRQMNSEQPQSCSTSSSLSSSLSSSSSFVSSASSASSLTGLNEYEGDDDEHIRVAGREARGEADGEEAASSIKSLLNQNGLSWLAENRGDRMALREICRRYNEGISFAPQNPAMAYTVRDPVQSTIYHVSHPRGFTNKLKIRSRMWDAHLVIDGGISFPFNDGMVAKFCILPEDSLRCVSILP